MTPPARRPCGVSSAVGLQHGKPAGGFADPSPLLFLLTNSRALEPEQVRQQLTVLCQRLKPLLAQLERPWLVVSRAIQPWGTRRSSLEVIRSELGPFAANLLVPAFPQGAHHRSSSAPVGWGAAASLGVARDRRFGYPAAICPNGLSTKQLERSQLIPWRG